MVKKMNIPSVRRITIDERLSEDLIRLEICELKQVAESGEFKDEPDFWGDIVQEGEEIVACSIDQGKQYNKGLYTDLMSIPESQIKQFPWKDLKEGQVFLAGEFEVKEEKNGENKVMKYFVCPGKKSFEQIDDDVKENTKTLYYEILAKGEKNGKL